jgi:hypothetical protein
MLSERDVNEIRSGVKEGIRGPVLSKWLEMLLRDRDERVKRDREIAARLLAASQAISGPSLAPGPLGGSRTE